MVKMITQILKADYTDVVAQMKNRVVAQFIGQTRD